MDANPNALSQIMQDKTVLAAKRLAAACTLAGWVSAGGKLPDDAESRFAVAEECRDYIRRLG